MKNGAEQKANTANKEQTILGQPTLETRLLYFIATGRGLEEEALRRRTLAFRLLENISAPPHLLGGQKGFHLSSPSPRMFAQSRVTSPSPEAIQSKAVTFRQRITRLKTTLVLFVSLIRLVGPGAYLTFERIVVGLPGHPSRSSKFIAAVKTQAKLPQHLGRTVHFQCPHERLLCIQAPLSVRCK